MRTAPLDQTARMSKVLLGITILISFSTFSLAGSGTAIIRVADGFDYPVGDRDGNGYHKARGFQHGGHPGEDWNGPLGGDTDLGDPVYSIGNGIVVLSRNVQGGWGNVVIVRHAFYDGGDVENVDSLYAHLATIEVREGQNVSRRQQVGTIGNNRGMYHAHLHFEIRRNLAIGMNRSSFPKDLQNYFDPTNFIANRRELSGGKGTAAVALNTFKAPETVLYADASSRKEARAGFSPYRPTPGLKLRITATFQKTQVRQFD
jgi:murein DD-endopeptidase MepM/ murein hydrolase activator NlpD